VTVLISCLQSLVVVPVASKSSPLATTRHPLPAADRLGAFRAVIAAYY